MNVLLCNIFLICMSNVSIFFLREASGQKGLGESACSYFGNVRDGCDYETVAVDKLPDSCTSFLYNGLTVNITYEISPRVEGTSNDVLDDIVNVGKNVYAIYGRETFGDWSVVLYNMDCNDTAAVEESKSINMFLEKHPGVKGFLLNGLIPQPHFEGVYVKTENLLKYIEILKRETKLEIGFSFNAYNFLVHSQKNSTSPWLDFKVLEKHVDIFFFSVGSFYNDCKMNMKEGVYPIDGSAPYTLEKLKSCVQQQNIPTEKTYYSSVLVPRTTIVNGCVVKSELLCTSPNISKDWCADTIEEFFKKGQWFKQNGVGFVGLNVNFDDPLGCCNCGPYPAFNAILAGVKGSSTAPKCPLYDRQV